MRRAERSCGFGASWLMRLTLRSAILCSTSGSPRNLPAAVSASRDEVFPPPGAVPYLQRQGVRGVTRGTLFVWRWVMRNRTLAVGALFACALTLRAQQTPSL